MPEISTWMGLLLSRLRVGKGKEMPSEMCIRDRKGVVRREMAMYADDPDSVAYQLLMQTLYLKHPRRWPVLGEPCLLYTSRCV